MASGGLGGQQGEVLKGLLVHPPHLLGFGSPWMKEMGMLLLELRKAPAVSSAGPYFHEKSPR